MARVGLDCSLITCAVLLLICDISIKWLVDESRSGAFRYSAERLSDKKVINRRKIPFFILALGFGCRALSTSKQPMLLKSSKNIFHKAFYYT